MKVLENSVVYDDGHIAILSKVSVIVLLDFH